MGVITVTAAAALAFFVFRARAPLPHFFLLPLPTAAVTSLTLFPFSGSWLVIEEGASSAQLEGRKSRQGAFGRQDSNR